METLALRENFYYLLLCVKRVCKQLLVRVRLRYMPQIKTAYQKEYFLGQEGNYDPYPVPRWFVEKEIFFPRIRQIQKYLPVVKKKKILDVGCSQGYFLQTCDALLMETYGIDVSTYAIQEAKKQTQATLVCMNAEHTPYPFEKNYFDVIVCFDSLEHMRHPEKVLRYLRTLLKKGGMLYITTPDGKQPGDKDETHVRLHTLSIWKTMVAHARYHLLESYVYRWYMVLPYLMLQKARVFLNKLRGNYIDIAVIIASKQ